MRILLIEDDSGRAKVIGDRLKAAEHVFDATDMPEDALQIVRLYEHDLVLCDLSLPGLDSSSYLKKLRREVGRRPILALCDENSLESRLKALAAGADDAFWKGGAPAELVARINATVRRTRGFADSVVCVGPIRIDLILRVAEVNGRPVQLTRQEFRILEILALRANHNVSKDLLMSQMYADEIPEQKVIDVYVCKVRRKLQTACGVDHIHTAWGYGYALRDRPVTAEHATTRAA